MSDTDQVQSKQDISVKIRLKMVELRQHVHQWAKSINWENAFKVLMAMVTMGSLVYIISGYIYEKQGLKIPGLGIAIISLFLYLLTMGFGYVAVRERVRGEITAVDYLRIDFCFPNNFEQVYDRKGERVEKELDMDDLEQERWVGVPAYELISVSDQQIQEILKEPGIVNRVELEKAVKEHIESRAKAKKEPGRKAYFYYIKLSKPQFYMERDARGSRVPRVFWDMIAILPALWDESFKFGPHRVPANGYRITHPHSERIELVLKDILQGDLNVFVCTTCAYVRAQNMEKIKPADNEVAMGIADTAVYFYDRKKAQVKPLEQIVQAHEASKDEESDAIKGARLDVLARMNMKMYSANRQQQIIALQQQQDRYYNRTPAKGGIPPWVTGLLAGGLILMIIIMIFGVI